jgi:copper transport protein
MTASIAIMPEGPEPFEPSEVTLVVVKADSGLEAISRPAHKMSDGTWQVEDLVIPLAGEWSARLKILVGDFEKIRLEAPVEIGP